MKRILLIPLVLGLVWSSLSVTSAQLATNFSMKDPKGVSSILFTLDSPYEPLSGVATGIDGSVSFDPADIQATGGEVTVQTNSLRMTLERMTEHLHSERWLDAERYPDIRFRFDRLMNVKQHAASVEGIRAGAAGTWSAEAEGELSLHGVTKRIVVPVSITWFPGKLQSRVANMEGDLMVVRSDFSIRRSDFHIDGGLPETIVSDRIDLRVRIVGVAPKTESEAATFLARIEEPK